MNPRTWTALVGVRAGRPHPLVKRSLTRPTWSRLLPDRLHQRKLGMSDRSASSASAREQEHKRQKLENGNNQAGEGLKSGERTASAAEPPRIELTAVEKSLRQLLLDVAEEIDASTSSHSVGQDGQARAQPSTESEDEKLQLRFTGGWVRDKILGVESHDIDVSINKMTGLQFGLKMKEYLGKAENAAKHGVSNAGGKGEVVTANAPSSESAAVVKSVAGNLHKIAANPEKSKHLETVTTRVFNLDVDLVNLRKETYADDSRNPQMEFGTPEEDALRRDATINALFYNIHTEAVEDHTQRGLDDMKNKFIRTPLDPHQTFKDDPLRILRLVRFSVRLSYEIDPAARTAMRHDAIREALLRKISRERVGQEMEKMLKGPDPRGALALIHQLELYLTVFTDPTRTFKSRPELEHWPATCDALGEIIHSAAPDKAPGTVKRALLKNADDEYVAWVLAATVPWTDVPSPQSAKPGGKQPPPAPYFVVREGIKAPSKICDIVTNAAHNLEDIRNVRTLFRKHSSNPKAVGDGDDGTARDTLGMAIRRWGSSWRSQVIYVLLYEVMGSIETKDAILQQYAAFLSHIETLGISDACLLKPLVDGKFLVQTMKSNPGPWVKEALDVVIAWQLRNPDKTDAQEVVEQLKNGTGELTAALARHFLQSTIRPLFTKASQNSKITSQGRRNVNEPLTQRFAGLDVEDEQPVPWKQDSHVLDLMEWLLHTLTPQMVEKNWPLLIPPLLTILDDPSIPLRTRGCHFIRLLLVATPPPLLARTGLADVLEEGLMPCVYFLPALTPVEESVPLLNAVYPALLQLAKVRHPPIERIAEVSAAKYPERVKFLFSIIRKGILGGMAHAGENVRIAEVLFQQLIPINDALGIFTVRHLQEVIPLITRVLSEPLGPTYVPLLLAATDALQSVMKNAHTRMGFYHAEVLKGLCLCWLNVLDEAESDDIECLKAKLKESTDMLKIAAAKDQDMSADYQLLIIADGRLKDLFSDTGDK